MRIFVTGDTHGSVSLNKISKKNWHLSRSLTKDDLLIICGDFGVLWKNNPDKEEIFWRNFLKQRPFTIAFIDGNHENHSRISRLPMVTKWGGIVGVVEGNVYHLRRGEVYNIGSKKIFTMGGAASIDKQYRTEGLSWWKEELPSYTEQSYALDNLDLCGWNVDYIMTHTPPTSLTKLLLEKSRISSIYPDSQSDFLQRISEKLQYKKWCCGHMHLDQDMGKYSLLYDRIIELGNDIINIEEL